LISLGISIVAAIEQYVFGYSYIADYFIRRAYAVIAQLQGAYVAYMLENFGLKDWLAGFAQLSNEPVSFLLGEWYFGNKNTNANTNAFLYSMLNGGVSGYVLAIVFITAIFSTLNYLYLKRGDKVIMSVALLYALLLTEQSYTTALLSSGIAASILIFILLRPSSNMSPGSLNISEKLGKEAHDSNH